MQEKVCFQQKIPGIAGDFYCLLLPLHVDQRFEHFIGDRDDLRVALEAALGDDHVRELVRVFFTGVLAERISLCYNIIERVFAINGRRSRLSP